MHWQSAFPLPFCPADGAVAKRRNGGIAVRLRHALMLLQDQYIVNPSPVYAKQPLIMVLT